MWKLCTYFHGSKFCFKSLFSNLDYSLFLSIFYDGTVHWLYLQITFKIRIFVLKSADFSRLGRLFLPSMMQVMSSWKLPRFLNIPRKNLEPVFSLDFLPFHGWYCGLYSSHSGSLKQQGLCFWCFDIIFEVLAQYSGHSFAYLISWLILLSYDLCEYLKLSDANSRLIYYVFNTMLLMLLVFHIYWWLLICAMIRRQLKNRGKVGEDIRSGM